MFASHTTCVMIQLGEFVTENECVFQSHGITFAEKFDFM